MKRSVMLGFTVFFVLIFSLFYFPNAVYAETGTLGTENPYLYAEYFSEDGKLADGNELSSGNYKMQLVLEGMSSVSEMEFTADYGSKVTFGDFSTIADEDTSFNSLCKIEKGSLILCIVSLNEDCSQINSDGTVLFTADITVETSSTVDMEQVIPVSTDPNYFFIEADYGDINKSAVPYIYDCYGLDTDSDKYLYSATIYVMECDLSPLKPQGFSVSGKVVAMLNPLNPDSYNGAPALAGVQVIINEEVVATTSSEGIFVIPVLEKGTYEATLHYANGFDRKIQIIVSDNPIDYTGTPITMVPCDYNNDGYINLDDVIVYKNALRFNSPQGDLDSDEFVNLDDTLIFKRFFKKSDIRNIYSNYLISYK